MDIVEFLRARLDEDEATARAAANGVTGIWQAENGGVLYGSDLADWPEESGNGVVVYDEGSPLPTQAEHIARHDPARVLREVEVKRRIIALEDASQFCEKAVMSEVLAHVAFAYSDHPDYEKDWEEWTHD